MANGGGGTVVFDVADKVRGRASALNGVPLEVNVNRQARRMRRDRPHAHAGVRGAARPRRDRAAGRDAGLPGPAGLHRHQGAGTVRVGKDCKPLTGTLRSRVAVETGESDFTAVVVDVPLSRLLSAAAMDKLREVVAQERASADLLGLGEAELLEAVGVLRQGKLTRAGLRLAESAQALREHIPGYVWTHPPMASGTEYTDRVASHVCSI